MQFAKSAKQYAAKTEAQRQVKQQTKKDTYAIKKEDMYAIISSILSKKNPIWVHQYQQLSSSET